MMRRIQNFSRKALRVRRTNSLGDVLAATCVANALIEQGHGVVFEAHANTHPILKRHDSIRAFTGINGSTPTVNLDGSYENNPLRVSKKMPEMYVEAANLQLAAQGIKLPVLENYAPRIHSIASERETLASKLIDYPTPWVMIAPRSNSFANKTVTDDTWKLVSKQISSDLIHPGTMFWLGSHGAAPKFMVDLQCRTVDNLIEYLALADIVVTAETGPMHIAAALGRQVFAVKQAVDPAWALSDQRDFTVIDSSDLTCLNCQQMVCPIANPPPCQSVSSVAISRAVTTRIFFQSNDTVSAVIAVYKPGIARLNKCIDHVLPQVNEVVVCCDDDTAHLCGMREHPKIKMVRLKGKSTGYGRKANFGARHSNGRNILFLNDDVFLNDNVVKHLKSLMVEGVGAVSHTLRYPDGLIQYAGTYRPLRANGFGHIDWKKKKSRYGAPVEQEAFCGASVLINRAAFYEADAHDERYRLYSEDTDAGMKLRKAGWKIIFTPLVEGTHLEHQTVRLSPEWKTVLEESARKFAAKWGYYFAKNPNPNVLGKF